MSMDDTYVPEYQPIQEHEGANGILPVSKFEKQRRLSFFSKNKTEELAHVLDIIFVMSFSYGSGFNGKAVKFNPSDHRVAVVVEKEIAGASWIDTHDFQSTDHPTTSSEIIQGINDCSWCSSKPDCLILAAEDGTALLWNVNFPNLIQSFNGHTSRITSVDCNPGNDTFITGSRDHTVKLWDVERGICQHTYDYPECVNSVSWNPCKETVHASTFFNGILCIRDVNNKEPSINIRADDSPITSLGWNCRSEHIVTTAMGKSCASVWDIRRPSAPLKVISGKHMDELCMVKFLPHKEFQIASCSLDGTVVLWDYATGYHDSRTTVYGNHKGAAVRGLDMSKKENGLLASIGSDGLVRTWIHIPPEVSCFGQCCIGSLRD